MTTLKHPHKYYLLFFLYFYNLLENLLEKINPNFLYAKISENHTIFAYFGAP